MKKFIKWFFSTVIIFIVLLIALMIIIPYFFKDEILSKVKGEINKSVNVKVEFTDVTLSLFKSFPDFNLGLIDLSVVGVDKFEKDTLLYLKSFNVEVDLMSALGKNVVVKGIVLNQPFIHAKVLVDSSANWDIVKPTEETQVEIEEPSTESSDFKLELQKFQINNATIIYSDVTSDMDASINNLNFLLKGDFGADYSDLSINTTIEKINVKMEGIRYLKDAQFGFDASIGADLVKSIYTFKENVLSINDIELAFDGKVEMPGNDIVVDIKFNTQKTSFKSLLSMVPVIYMQGFEELKTSGNLALNGEIKGIMNDSITPSANLKLIVENAMFQYPDLPKSVENINIDLAVLYDGVNNDNTKIDLNKFHLEMAQNPFDIVMHVRTPMSDPFIEAKMLGKIILKSFKDIIPMENANIDGEINADVSIAGNLSTIENEKYEEFKASGKLQLKDFIFESEDLPQTVKIIETTFNFTPKYLELQSFKSQIGKSDFNLNGKIENYIAYVLKNETIKGNFNFSSTFIDANEFMSEDTEETVTDTAEVPITVFEVPGNVDFTLQSSLSHILYDKMDITNLKGTFIVKDKKVVMNNLNMNLLDGSIGINGEYNTQDITKPAVVMALDIRDMEIQTAVHSIDMIGKMASILENCKGKVSIKFDYTSLLDSTMSPVLNSIEGYGRLQSKEIQVVNSKTLDKLFELVKIGDKSESSFNDVNVSFKISNGRINVEPFETKVGDIKMLVGGSHGIDQTMDYDLALNVPMSYFGSAANQVLEGLLNKASSQGINIEKTQSVKLNAKITGTTMDPKISLGKGTTESNDSKSTKEQLKDEVKAKAGEELSVQAAKIIEDAEKEAAKLKEDAQIAADKILKEGNEKADALVKKAAKEGAFAKIAAEKTASEVKKEAKNKADNLVKEAGVKADKLVEDAKIKADKLQADGK